MTNFEDSQSLLNQINSNAMRVRKILKSGVIALAVLLLFTIEARSQKIWTLEDCINYALENNLDIQKQIQSVESNKANLTQSAIGLLPSLNANGTN